MNNTSKEAEGAAEHWCQIRLDYGGGGGLCLLDKGLLGYLVTNVFLKTKVKISRKNEIIDTISSLTFNVKHDFLYVQRGREDKEE